MSYPYSQFPGDFSQPPTPHLGPVDWPEQDVNEHHQQQQHHQQQHQQTIVASDLHSPLHGGFPATIQLDEPPAVVPSHREQPHVIQLQPAEQDTSQQQSKSTPQPGMMSSATTVIRSGRSKQHQQAQQQTHPYARPSNPRSTRQPMQTQGYQVPQTQHQEHHVHFAAAPVLTRVASGSGGSSSRPSPLIPSPTNKMTNFGSTSNSPAYNSQSLPKVSPRTMDPPPLPASVQQQQQQSEKAKVYSVRMDTAYDAESHMMTAMLEMPGVRQEHLTLRLSTCSYNGVRQLSVSGTLHPPAELLPLINRPTVVEGSVRTFGHRKLLSERRYGMFQRVFPVPATTRREDVTAKLQDGVLTITFKCPEPVDEDEIDVPVYCPTTA